jgi:hypothetical protein
LFRAHSIAATFVSSLKLPGCRLANAVPGHSRGIGVPRLAGAGFRAEAGRVAMATAMALPPSKVWCEAFGMSMMADV